MSTALTLYDIKTELLELLDYRLEVMTDRTLSEEDRKASLDAWEKSVREYVGSQVKTPDGMDGIAYYLREFDMRAEVADDEAARLAARARAWRQKHDNLKDLVISIMQETGQTKLEGKSNTLSLRKCPASVEVAQPDLVPTAYQRRTITITEEVWIRLQSVLMTTERGAPLYQELIHAKVTEPEAMKSKIGDELKTGKCLLCDHTGRVKMTFESGPPQDVICPNCEGSGYTGRVPGCRLITDKKTLVVK